MTADLQFLHQASTRSCLEELRAAAAVASGLLALVHPTLSQTHAELQTAWEATRRWLSAKGLPASCRVLLLADNQPEAVWLQLALLADGAQTALVDARTNREALLLMAEEFRPSVVLCTADLEERAAEAAAAVPRCLLVSAAGLREAVAAAPAAPPRPLSQDGRVAYFRMDREDHWRGAWFGLPQLGATARQTRQLFSLHLGSAVLCQMGIAHYLALSTMVLPALCSGGTLVLLERSCGEDVLLDAIAAHNPRLMVHYRKSYWFLARAAERRRALGLPLGTVQHAVVNADSPQLPFRAQWEELFQGHLLAGFATTFAGSFLTLNLPWLEDRVGYTGKALPGVELRILDETGAERPTGRWGEVLFRSPGMACAFTGDDHANPELGVHGFKVSPLEVEDPLRELPGVVDAAAVNAPRSTHPDQVHLYVHVEEDGEGRPRWTEEGLLERCRELFPPYLRPARVFLVEEIPHDDEGFKLRKELKYRTPTADLWRSM
jgi:long-chain acyl-CoA synthetase